MIDKRIMYAQGQRVAKTLNGSRPGYAGPNEPNDGQGVGAGAPGPGDTGGEGGTNPNDKSDTQTTDTTTDTTTDSGSDFDPFGHSRFAVGSGYYGEPVTSSPSNLGEGIVTFAPTVTKPSIWDNIKTFGANAATLALFSSTGISLNPTQVAIANFGLNFGKKTGLTKSGSISELGINTLSSIGDVFSGNTNKGNTNKGNIGINTNSFSGNTNNSLSDTNQNNGGESGNNDMLSSEYILLLQKMQLGNFTQEDETRFNLLKTMLGK